MTPRRGEIWWGESERFGRRPVLVLTRTAAIPVLGTIVVAPLTQTARGIPTEVMVGPDDGVPKESVVSLDNLDRVSRGDLAQRVTALGPDRMHEVCLALKASLDC